MQEIIRVSDVEKYYGNGDQVTKAVDRVSFAVQQGEFIGVMRASGSGKTTLLNLLSTIDRVTAGHIYYGDRLYKATENYMLRMEEPPYTPSVNKREKSSFLDSFPMEYPTGGIGDYRESCLNVRNEAGQMGCEIHYVSHEIYNG